MRSRRRGSWSWRSSPSRWVNTPFTKVPLAKLAFVPERLSTTPFAAYRFVVVALVVVAFVTTLLDAVRFAMFAVVAVRFVMMASVIIATVAESESKKPFTKCATAAKRFVAWRFVKVEVAAVSVAVKWPAVTCPPTARFVPSKSEGGVRADRARAGEVRELPPACRKPSNCRRLRCRAKTSRPTARPCRSTGGRSHSRPSSWRRHGAGRST